MDNDGTLTPVDVQLLANYVYRSWVPPNLIHHGIGDCDCDGHVAPTDVAVLVQKVYYGNDMIPICFIYDY